MSSLLNIFEPNPNDAKYKRQNKQQNKIDEQKDSQMIYNTSYHNNYGSKAFFKSQKEECFNNYQNNDNAKVQNDKGIPWTSSQLKDDV